MPRDDLTRSQMDALVAGLLDGKRETSDPPFFAKVLRREAEEDEYIDPFTVPGIVRIPSGMRDPQLRPYRKADRLLMERVVSRDRRTCYLCRKWIPLDGKLCVDHIVPRSLGGRSILQNLGVACAGCNMQKGERLTRRRPPALGGTLSREEAILAASG